MMKVSDFMHNLAGLGVALAKVLLQSRRPGYMRDAGAGRQLYILANGPSLADVVNRHSDFLSKADTLCVNFMANTPQMFAIRPCHYVLADPHFFRQPFHENVSRLWDNIRRVDWPMTLHVPHAHKRVVTDLLAGNTCVSVSTFNLVGIDTFAVAEDFLFDRQLAMPRPRNVLIPSIMLGLWAGYKTIWLAGADHSWLRTIGVDDDNCVISIQPHFYQDPESEKTRSRAEYRGFRLHDILLSFYIAFRSYHSIARWARHCGAEVINITPGSFIDAFRRAAFPAE